MISTFSRLWRDTTPKVRLYFLAFGLVTLMLGAIQGFEVYMIKPLIDTLLGKHYEGLDLSVIAFLYLITGTVKAVGMYLEVSMLARFILCIGLDLRNRLMKATIGLSLSDVNIHGTSHYLSLFFSDIEKFVGSFKQTIDALIGQGMVLIMIISVMLFISPTLFVVCVVLVVMLAFPLLWIGKRIRRSTNMLHEDFSTLTEMISELLRGLKQIKAFNAQKRSEQSSSEWFNKLFALEYRSWIAMAPLSMITGFSISLIIGLLLLGGKEQLMDGTLGIAQIASFFAALITAYRPLRVISNVSPLLFTSATALQRLYTVIDKPNVDEKTYKLPSIAIDKGEIVFDDVSFYYDTPTDLPVLKNISLTIQPGEMLALVGPTGAGKSSLLSLIPRFFDAVTGRILIDGQDISQVNVYSLRRHIALVSQDVQLFAGTVRSNLNLAQTTDQPLSDSVLRESLERVGLWDVIAQKPDGLDASIGEGGHGFSGGQQQLLSLARAFLMNPKILLFDEPTSSLDSSSEEHIRDTIKKLYHGKTMVIVAHRLSTIRSADRIIVLEHGMIKEIGNHETLITANGLYASYIKKQYPDST